MRARIIWIGIIVGILGITLVMYGVVIVITMTDPTFSVEPDYDKKALDWDSVQHQMAMNEKLGWQITLKTESAPRRGERLVRVTVCDDEQVPIKEAVIDLVAFHNARASDIYRSQLEYKSDGVYTTIIPIRRAGLWEFRLTVNHKEQIFTEKIRKSIAIQSGDR